MTPGIYNLDIYRGDTYNWTFNLWFDTAQTLPADLTGVLALAEIRTKPAGSLMATLNCTVTLPNIIKMILAPDQSMLLSPKATVWDLQLTYPDGSVGTVLAGSVTVTMDVTDSSPCVYTPPPQVCP